MSMIDFAERYTRVICYGAGEWAVRARILLRDAGMEPEIYCVTHLDERDIGKDFLGYPLIEAVKLPQVILDQPDTGIIVAVARHQEEIRITLKNLGIKDDDVYYSSEEDFPPHDVPCPGVLIEYHLRRLGYGASEVAQSQISLFEHKLQTIVNAYGHIEVRFVIEPLGAVIAHYMYYHNDAYHDNREDKPYYLLISSRLTRPTTTSTMDNLTPLSFPNALLMAKLKGKGVEPLLEDNLTFWRYCFGRHSECFKGDFRDHYQLEVIPRLIGNQKQHPHKEQYDFLTLNEKRRGEQEAMALGLSPQQEFICFFAREPQYFQKNCFVAAETELSVRVMDEFRNSDVHDFDLMVDAMAEHGVMSVRMGRESKPYVHDGALDFPNAAHSDLLDFYLNSRCLFYIGTGSGASIISTLFARPVVLTNLMCVWLLPAEAALPFTTSETDLVLYQKYYDKHKGRLLTLREILECEFRCCEQADVSTTCTSYVLPRWYHEHDIVPVKNTPEEIRDVAMEMYQRLKGECVYDAEDLELRARYWEIIKSCKVARMEGILSTHANIGRAFLKQNRWFLQ